jgi:periplasmic protein TonB
VNSPQLLFSTIRPSTNRYHGAIAVAGAHILLILMALQLQTNSALVRQVTPLMVSIIDVSTSKPQPQSLEIKPLKKTMTLAPVALPAELPQRAVSEPASEANLTAATLPAQSTPRAQNQPDVPLESPASAVPSLALRPPVVAQLAMYKVAPAAELPRLSRRAGESGIVWLHVWVDSQGQPTRVTVHRSSGHARLDEQAVWAMRQARFKPYTEDGRAVEVEVIAPIEYPAD